MRQKLAYIIKRYTWVQFFYRVIMSFAFRILGLFVGSDPKLVLLSAMSGDQYDGSPRVLFEKMRCDPLLRDYRYVWAFSHPEQFVVEGADTVKMDSLAYFITALKAKIWITDVNIERGLRFKKKHTIYLNTWHGTGPKKIGGAVKGRKDYDFSHVDIICVDGQYFANEMLYWFNAKKENLLWCGRPREDELLTFTPEDREKVRQELNIPEGKKAILYMPTWREYPIAPLDYTLWEDALGDEYVVLVRFHHFTHQELLKREDGFWREVSDYPNVNKLYLAADILVSDYSSAFFDYGLLGKPMICFAYDYEQYCRVTGLHMDIQTEFPDGLKYTDEKVVFYIRDMDYESASRKCKAYCDSYVQHPGSATEACIRRLKELIA